MMDLPILLLQLGADLLLVWLVIIKPMLPKARKEEFPYVALNSNKEWSIYECGSWWAESDILNEIDDRGPPEWEALFKKMLIDLHAGKALSKELLA